MVITRYYPVVTPPFFRQQLHVGILRLLSACLIWMVMEMLIMRSLIRWQPSYVTRPALEPDTEIMLILATPLRSVTFHMNTFKSFFAHSLTSLNRRKVNSCELCENCNIGCVFSVQEFMMIMMPTRRSVEVTELWYYSMDHIKALIFPGCELGPQYLLLRPWLEGKAHHWEVPVLSAAITTGNSKLGGKVVMGKCSQGWKNTVFSPAASTMFDVSEVHCTHAACDFFSIFLQINRIHLYHSEETVCNIFCWAELKNVQKLW